MMYQNTNRRLQYRNLYSDTYVLIEWNHNILID